MAQKQQLVEVWADFEQTIVNKASRASDWGLWQNYRTTLKTLAIYDISHCED